MFFVLLFCFKQARTLVYFSVNNISAITKINSTKGDRGLCGEARVRLAGGTHQRCQAALPGSKLGNYRAGDEGGVSRCSRGAGTRRARGGRGLALLGLCRIYASSFTLTLPAPSPSSGGGLASGGEDSEDPATAAMAMQPKPLF